MEMAPKNKQNKLSITRSPIEGFESTTVRNFKPCNNCCLLIELAYRTTKSKNVLTHVDGDFDEIIKLFQDNNTEDLQLSPSELQECMYIFKNLCENSSFLQDQQMKPKFLDFLVYIYPIIRSSELKSEMLQVLKFNNVSIDELLRNFPLETHTITIPHIAPTDEFSDIIITVDENAEGLSSSMYKTAKEDIKKAAIGHSPSLEAFTKGTFTVLRNRKSANIENTTLKQNHEVLNLVASNGVICTPETKEILSLDLLMRKLSKCTNFTLIFVHPALEQKIVSFDKPTDFSKPDYSLNSGELIAVVYRYVLINFFGLHSIIDEDKLEYQYLF
jgi:hypothetical protein